MFKTIVSLILIFLLSGCSGSFEPSAQDVAKLYSGNFSVSVNAEYGEKTAGIKTEKNRASIRFYVESPEELNGLSIVLSDEHAKISYNGMEQTIDDDNLPKNAPFLLLEELFDELSDPEEFYLSTENGELTATGDNFTAVLSKEDFSIISAAFPMYDTEFSFSEWDFSSAG